VQSVKEGFRAASVSPKTCGRAVCRAFPQMDEPELAGVGLVLEAPQGGL
jgi:hypothetical protein